MTDASRTSPSIAEAIGKGAALLLAVGVLIQGYLAARHLALGGSIDIHGIIGDTLFLIAVVPPVVALLRRHDGWRFGLGVACAALVFAQIGLGYVGRESADSRAWHIANGVLVSGLSGAQAMLWLRPSAWRSPAPAASPET